MYSRKLLLLTLLFILLGASSLGAAPPEYLLVGEPREPVETALGSTSIKFDHLSARGVVLGRAEPAEIRSDFAQMNLDPLDCTALAMRFAPNRRGEGGYDLLDPSGDALWVALQTRIGDRGHMAVHYAPTDPEFVLDSDGQAVGIDCGVEASVPTIWRFAPDGTPESLADGVPRSLDPFRFSPQEVLPGGEVMVWYPVPNQPALRAYLYLDGEWVWLNQVDRKARNAISRDIASNGDILFHRGIPGGGQEGVVYYAEDGTAEKLPHLGGGSTVPAAIDAKGRVIGGSYVDRNTYHAFLYTRDGGMRDLHLDGYRLSSALEMTAKGVVIGTLDERAGSFPDTIFRYDKRRGMRILISAAEFEALLPPWAKFRGVDNPQVNNRLELVGVVHWRDPVNAGLARTTPYYYSPRVGLLEIQDLVDAAGGGFDVHDFELPQLSARGDILLGALADGELRARRLLMIQTKKAR